MNTNASAFKRSCRTRMTLEAARRFKDKTFYCPWSFDYRGRAYPIPSFLTPQDTDFGKALLIFDRASLVTPEAQKWLGFQVATTFGLDKHQWKRDSNGLKKTAHSSVRLLMTLMMLVNGRMLRNLGSS